MSDNTEMIHLSNKNSSEVYELKENEITKINNWLVGIIYFEKYDILIDHHYWKKKYFMLTEFFFTLISRHNYKRQRKYKLSTLCISGISGDGNNVFFYIYKKNKKNKKKSLIKLTTTNLDGLLLLHKELNLSIKCE